MKRSSPLLIGIILLATVTLAGQLEAQTSNRDAWIAGVSIALPSALCEHEYFTSCFEAGRDECEQAAVVAVESCIEKFRDEMPGELTPADGALWGQMMGQCAGLVLEARLAARKSAEPRCADASAWR
jgi:hypothetical protein